jgi:hypothetical protein
MQGGNAGTVPPSSVETELFFLECFRKEGSGAVRRSPANMSRAA